MRLVFLGLMVLTSGLPATATALPVPVGTSTDTPFRVELGGRLFSRVRYQKTADGPSSTRFALTRGRMTLDFWYRDLLHIQVEPDFAQDDADPADVYGELRAHQLAQLRVGLAKVPFGLMESLGRWRLPTQQRGLVSDLVSDRLGIGGRRFGARYRADVRDSSWRPRLELGVYRDSAQDEDTDVALRMGVRPQLKGARVELAGYARGGAAIDGGFGYAGALSFEWDRKWIFVAAELLLVRARLLSLTGQGITDDATLFGVRMIFAPSFRIATTLRVEPYAGFESVDPNARTKDDLGFALRGGLNLRFEDLARIGFDIDHQRGQRAFVAPERTQVTIFLGLSLK